MFRSLTIAALIAVTTAPAHAQTAPAAQAAAPINPQRLAAARDLMDAMQIKDMMRQSVSAVFKQIESGAIEQTVNQLPGGADELAKDPYFKERMRRTTALLGEEMTNLVGEFTPRFIEAMANAYARNFTVAELGQATTFFRSPVGQKFGLIMPQLVADPSVKAVQVEMMRSIMGRMPALVKRIEDATRDLPLPPKPDQPEKE